MSELIFKTYSEQRDNSTKFIYFLFSTTIITLGFCMTLAKGIHPTWWTLLWGVAIILMFFSMYFGYLCIQINHKVLGYLGIQYTVNHVYKELENENIDLIRKQILDIKEINLIPTSLIQMKEWIVIELSKNKTNTEFRNFILNTDKKNLINEIIKLHLIFISRAQCLPVDSIDDLMAKVSSLDKAATCYFNRQVKLLSLGFFILFIWNVSSFSYI